MRRHRFYKNELGWFIDLKRFPFNKAWLAMVAGADTLLDQLSNGNNEIELQISTSPIPYSDGVLHRLAGSEEMGLFQGRFYESEPGYTNKPEASLELLWLCAVTLWVFWKYPKKIYYKIC